MALIDTLHSLTGLPLPRLDFSRLGKNVEAFGLLIEIHYKHFQYYSNMVVASAIAYTCYRVKLGGMLPLGWLDLLHHVLHGLRPNADPPFAPAYSRLTRHH